MKIYGKSFGEVFELLPWQFKLIVVAGFGFILFIILHFAILLMTPPPKHPAEALRISGLGGAYSVFDPSLAVDPEKKQAWLAFARVQKLGDRGKYAPGVSLASSMAPCRRWDVLPVFDGMVPHPDTLYAPDNITEIVSGTWRYETPGLVYDASDPGREWKLYAYKYMWTEDLNVEAARRYSVIVYRYAHDPRGEWSPEIWQFSPAPDYPPPPYQEMVQVHVNDLDPSLAGVTLYSRPSVVSVDGVLVMSLSAFTTGKTPDRIVMLASYDHGASWKYLGTPLAAGDAAKVGPYTVLDGASLLKQNGTVYLAAVLGDDKTAGLGTFVFPFSDFTKGELRRDDKGAPVLLNHLPRFSAAPTEMGGGFAAYDDACEGGVLTGEFSGVKVAFQIFRTYKKLVGED